MQINGDKRTDYDDVCGVRTTADIWHTLYMFELLLKVIAWFLCA